MKERIRELAEQAGVFAGDFTGAGLYSIHNKDEVEKFAELIVLECESVAKNPQWYSESPSDGWRNPIRHVCNVMKEHFGVER